MNRNSKKRVKVVFKKRFKFNILIIFILILGVSFFTSKSFGKREIHTYNYTVSSNDTLWNISKDVCNKSNENLDIQNVVHDIKYRNKLSNSDIYVGQVLEIPIY